ncbi:MAG: hypothetical protein GEV12_15915 [Micromonosporaceae bacterium]|nr:hypothetical protein [Micromonosporaceae bacterium]
MSAPDPNGGDLTSTLGALATPELVPSQRRRLLSHLTSQLPPARAWRRPATAVHWAADSVGELAPHVPVRSLATLHEHHSGLAGDQLADRLVRNAARSTAGVGAASGGLAAVKWTVPPTLLTAPVLLCVETVAVVAIEIKLIGELYETYRVPVPGTRSQQAVTLLQAWARQRGVNPLLPGAGVTVALGTAARKELVERLARRYVRNLPTLAPLLAGAAVAAILNRRGTRALGRQVRADLARLTG